MDKQKYPYCIYGSLHLSNSHRTKIQVSVFLKPDGNMKMLIYGTNSFGMCDVSVICFQNGNVVSCFRYIDVVRFLLLSVFVAFLNVAHG